MWLGSSVGARTVRDPGFEFLSGHVHLSNVTKAEKEDFYPSSKIRFNKRLTIYLSYSYIPMLPFQNLDTLTSFGAR